MPPPPPLLTFNGIPVKQVKDTKHLGLILDRKLKFSNHMNEKLGKARSSTGVMKQVKNRLIPNY